MTGKGDTYRKVKWQHFGNNYDRIFGKQNETSKKERLREFNRIEYTESNWTFDRNYSDFKEGSVQYAEYSVQYHAPTTDN